MAPEIVFEMDRDLAPVGNGFYPVERGGDRTFAWSSGRASITLPGLDRRETWSCSMRFRGARPDPAMPQPNLDVAVDGATAAIRRATNEFQDLDVTVPARPSSSGLILTLTSSTTFVPGESDRRELGVQFDRVACGPVDAWVVPPRGPLGSAALAGALLGGAFALTGITAASAVGASVLAAIAQAWVLTTGVAAYGPFPVTMLWLAFWITLPTVAVQKVMERRNGEPFRNTARFVMAFSAGVLYLKLLVLLHPSKELVDALFHAHRFADVLAGRWYFTQLSTSATPFPYAIGLYLFAAPWSVLTHDYVTLLRIVVCASEALAGALLYVMIVRTWGDRFTGAVAVGLFSLVPLSYVIAGHANMTNAFGQSVFVVTMVAVALWALGTGRPGQLIGLSFLAALGFIGHVSTFALLLPTLVLVALCYWALGGPALRVPAGRIVLATGLAVVLAVVVYYGHFGDVYRAQLERMTATDAALAGPTEADADSAARSGEEPVLGRDTIPMSGRVSSALWQTVANVGWPILILAMVGAWRLWVEGARDRLGLTVVAWGTTCVAFLVLVTLMAADRRYQQDAWEFIGRVEHAAYPAAVIVAARGAVWAWRAGLVTRIAASTLLLGAVVIGVRAWSAWLD